MSKSDHEFYATLTRFVEERNILERRGKDSPWRVLVRHVLNVFLARVLIFFFLSSLVTSSALEENNKTARKTNKINYLISHFALGFEFPSGKGRASVRKLFAPVQIPGQSSKGKRKPRLHTNKWIKNKTFGRYNEIVFHLTLVFPTHWSILS